jgi:hypothetical protein
MGKLILDSERVSMRQLVVAYPRRSLVVQADSVVSRAEALRLFRDECVPMSSVQAVHGLCEEDELWLYVQHSYRAIVGQWLDDNRAQILSQLRRV